MAAVGPRMARGIWSCSSRRIAAARMPTAVSSGGIEECPPSARAVSPTVTYPFSAIPITATGAETPAINPLVSAPPSSSTNSGCTLRDASRSAMRAAPRLGSRPEEMLHRLAESDEAALVVERAPAPHISAGDPALEWRLGPAGLRAGLDRNHVLMSQQHDRWDTRIGSRPLVQQTVAVHFLELQGGMELWERGSQVALEAIELTSVELARILKGDGLEAQRAGQALRERRRVERLDRHRRRLGLARPEREGALEHDDREDHHHDEQGAETLFHSARKCRDRARSARGPGGRFIDYTPLHDFKLRLRRRALFPDGPHRAGTGDLLDRRLSHRRVARGLGPAQPRPRRATAGFQPRGAAMCHHPSPRGSLRKPRPARGRAADYPLGTRDWRIATRRRGHPLPAVPSRRLGRPAAGPRRAARRWPRDVAIPIPGDSHPRPRNRPRGLVRARARLALLGRPVSRPPAPLPPRRRRCVRDDGLVAAGAGARAAGVVLPAPRARRAGRGTAARQARLPGRAGRADPRAARTRMERHGHRACAPGERPLVADVDRR